MAKLTILRGVSGSGKSTWAEAQAGNVLIVSRDSLRVAFYGSDGQDYYRAPDLRAKEETITVIQDATIEAALRAGKDVLVDNTNVEWKYVKALAKIANKVGAEVEVKVFDVPQGECHRRNQWRASQGGREVPAEVINRQYDQLAKTKNLQLPIVAPVKPYSGTPGKPKAFLVDIDGTLAHMRDYRGPFEWHNVGLDDVDETIANIVAFIQTGSEALREPHSVIIMSGRDEVCRNETLDWLDKANIWSENLFMRPEGDMRSDNIVKAELFDTHIRDNFDVQFVLDDRWAVCEMWLRMGLKVLNCSGLDRGEF